MFNKSKNDEEYKQKKFDSIFLFNRAFLSILL